MSSVNPPEVPNDYSDAYERAYRQSLSAHPTELMSPARPGKRAANTRSGPSALIAHVLADARYRGIVVALGVLALLLLAYGAGRLLA